MMSQTLWLLLACSSLKSASTFLPPHAIYQSQTSSQLAGLSYVSSNGRSCNHQSRPFFSPPCISLAKRCAKWGHTRHETTVDMCSKYSMEKSYPTSTPEDGAAQRRPPISHDELPDSVAYYYDSATGTDVYLVGCFHVSAVSAEDVRSVVRKTRPEWVVL